MTDDLKDPVKRDASLSNAFTAGWTAAGRDLGDPEMLKQYNLWWEVVTTFRTEPSEPMKMEHVGTDWAGHPIIACSCGAEMPVTLAPSEDGSEGERDCNCHPSDCTPGPECSPAPPEGERIPVTIRGIPSGIPGKTLIEVDGRLRPGEWVLMRAPTTTSEGGEREAVDLPGGIEGEVWSVDDVLPVERPPGHYVCWCGVIVHGDGILYETNGDVHECSYRAPTTTEGEDPC